MPRLHATKLAVVGQSRGKGRLTFGSAASSYLAAVETADGQPLEDSTFNTLGAFADWRIPLGGACCLMTGPRTLAGALTPMVGPSPTGVNLVAGDYNRTNGVTGDGVSKHVNTGYNNNVDPQDSQHAFVGLTARGALSRSLIGAGVTDIGSLLIRDENTIWRYRHRQAGSVTTAASAGESGVLGISRTEAVNVDLYRLAGVSTVAHVSQVPFNGNVLLFARGTVSSPSDFSQATEFAYSIGGGLDQATGNELVSRLNAAKAAITAALA